MAVGLDQEDSALESRGEVGLEVRSRIYRAITRAQMMACIVNEGVRGGWLEFLGLVRLDKERGYDEDEARRICGSATETARKVNKSVSPVVTQASAAAAVYAEGVAQTRRESGDEGMQIDDELQDLGYDSSQESKLPTVTSTLFDTQENTWRDVSQSLAHNPFFALADDSGDNVDEEDEDGDQKEKMEGEDGEVLGKNKGHHRQYTGEGDSGATEEGEVASDDSEVGKWLATIPSITAQGRKAVGRFLESEKLFTLSDIAKYSNHICHSDGYKKMLNMAQRAALAEAIDVLTGYDAPSVGKLTKKKKFVFGVTAGTRFSHLDGASFEIIGMREFPYNDGGKLNGNERMVEREYWLRVTGIQEYVILRVHYEGRWNAKYWLRNRDVVHQASLRFSVAAERPKVQPWLESRSYPVRGLPDRWRWKAFPEVHPGLSEILFWGEQCENFVR